MTYKNSFCFSLVVVLVFSVCVPASLHGVIVKPVPNMSVPNVSQTVDCGNFAHRLTICFTCICMFLVIVGVLVLLFTGKLRPQDIGNWKAGTGMAVIFLFLYEVFKVTLGNCQG
jgi:hypothetical protein